VTRKNLSRSHHTLTLIDDNAYIFGGQLLDGSLAGDEIHAVALPSHTGNESDYAPHNAEALEDGSGTPAPRMKHAACSRGKHVVVHGGCDDQSKALEESCLWLWDSNRSKWAKITWEGSGPSDRFDHKIFAEEQQDLIILHGGRNANGADKLTDTWIFDMDARTWTEVAQAPTAASDAAFADGTLYTITGVSDVSCEMHVFKIGNVKEDHKAETAVWQTITIPTNPLIPGPKPREGSALLPIDTGYGRQYLVYIFGCREDSAVVSEESAKESPYYSDLWVYQLPSKSAKPASWTDLKPAVIKDKIREKLGYDSGGHSWAEVEIQANEQVAQEGKVHPGPRGYFGADVTKDGKHVMLWGGVNAKGEKEGDGWLISLS